VYRDPTVCDRCGAVYTNKTWRRGRTLSSEMLDRAAWATCPGCLQARSADEHYGRIVIRGSFVKENLRTIQQRIHNVARRAEFTQPQRKIVSEDWDGKTLEVLTTSQKLAHRIVHELKKLFRGKTHYAWSDSDNSLYATWERDLPKGLA
jgi:hypothetical protein